MRRNSIIGLLILLAGMAHSSSAQQGLIAVAQDTTLQALPASAQQCSKTVTQILNQLNIQYPEQSRHERVEGSVHAEIALDARGLVTSVRPVSQRSDFADAVVQSTKVWSAQPIIKGGLDAPMNLNVNVDFILEPENHVSVPFPNVNKSEDVVIELRRSGCLGLCPEYSLKIHGDGRIEYDGRAYVFLIGKHAGQISREEFGKLIEDFRQADYFSLEDEYPVRATTIRLTTGNCKVERSISNVTMDASGVGTSIQIGNMSKRIYEEEDAPRALKMLEDEIDQYSRQWTYGSAETVNGILAEGRDINARIKGSPLIMRAAAYTNSTVIEDLVRAGAAVNVSGPSGDTPLMYAAHRGNPAMVKVLLQAGAEKRTRDNKGLDAFLYAASSGNEKTVRIFLDAGADVNERDKYGSTPLIFASAAGSPAVVKLLLDAKARVNDRDNMGWTALIAGAKGHLDYDTSPRKSDLIPYIPPELLDRPAVVRILIAAGADISVSGKYGETVFSEGSEDVIKELLKLGVGVNARDEDGNVPLAKVESADEARILIEAGADVELANSNGETPLMSAAGSGFSSVVKVLIEAGAKIDRQDSSGRTALMYAADAMERDEVKILLGAHANVNLRDKKGKTALTIAKDKLQKSKTDYLQSQYQEIIDLLVGAGAVK